MAFDVRSEDPMLQAAEIMPEKAEDYTKVRKNESFLASFEAPLLQWLAARVPSHISSDDMTRLGLAGAFLAAAGFALSGFSPGFLWLAPIGLAVNWLGDSLDGTLARVRQNERPQLGYFIDHTTDIVAQVAVGVGCGLSPYVRLDLACLALIGYLALSVLTYIRAIVSGVTQISYFGMGPTEIRLFLIISSLYFFFFGQFSLDAIGIPVRLSDAVTFFVFVAELWFFARAARQDFYNLRDSEN